jgi:thiosulfate dehydrogenase [quinone] large subunit
MGRAAATPLPLTEAQRKWQVAGLAMLSVRFIQGFVYWGGGSRRFIYGPSKLDPSAPQWMANKFQTAMPGALFGTDHVISFLLHHFYLLYVAVILFSAAELIAGLMLMVGLLTRAAALVSVGFSVVLMALFGWQGATCIDEWTMAACNLAMGAVLVLGGSSAYSLDNVLLRRNPALAERTWFRWMGGSLPLPQTDGGFRTLALALFTFVAVYDVSTYSYYRGSVLTPFHGGPVSPTAHHVTLSNGVILPNGDIRVHAYLDAGTPEAPLHIVDAALVGGDKAVLAQWDAQTLSHLSKTNFENDYAYNKFAPGPFGIRAGMGAAATITLPKPHDEPAITAPVTLTMTDVDGRVFRAALSTSR